MNEDELRAFWEKYRARIGVEHGTMCDCTSCAGDTTRNIGSGICGRCGNYMDSHDLVSAPGKCPAAKMA